MDSGGGAETTSAHFCAVPASYPCSSMDIATPHTVAADTPASADRSYPATERRPTVPSPLPRFPSLRKAGRSKRKESDDTRHSVSKSPPPSSPPNSSDSSTHRYLLEVILQQQERIMALQTSLLYATDFAQRASRPFSFEDEAADDSARCEADGNVPQHIPWGSPPVSPEITDDDESEDAAAAVPATPRSSTVRALFKTTTSTAQPTSSPTRSTPSTRGVAAEAYPAEVDVEGLEAPCAAEVAHGLKDTCEPAAVASCEGPALHLRLDVQAAPVGQREAHTALPPADAAPLTQRNRSVAVDNDDDNNNLRGDGGGVGISVAWSEDDTTDASESSHDEVDTEDRLLHHQCPPRSSSPPSGERAELASLQRRFEALSTAHQRLRLRWARRDCERRDIVDGLRAMVGCVQAVLEDSRPDASPGIPTAALNVLEYVVRQCSRCLRAAGAGGQNSTEANAATQSSSPAGGGRAAPLSPRIVLHRLRDRWFS